MKYNKLIKISICTLLLISSLSFSLEKFFHQQNKVYAQYDPSAGLGGTGGTRPGKGGGGGGGGGGSKPSTGKYTQTKKYWTKTITFKKIKVYQAKNQFKFTKNNIKRMKKGNAPIGIDKKSINLHHMTQRNTSSIAEVTATFHRKNSKVLHINSNKIPSGINRSQFNSWKKSYWKWRVNHR